MFLTEHKTDSGIMFQVGINLEKMQRARVGVDELMVDYGGGEKSWFAKDAG